MEKAAMLNAQMKAVFGDSRFAEPYLWFSSTFLGIVICKYVYDVIKSFSSSYLKSYKNLSEKDQVEWNNRGISTAHAILVSAAAAYLLVFSDFFHDGGPNGLVVFRSNIFSQTVLGVSVGYFLSDIAMIIWFYPALGGAEYIIHHFLSMSSIMMGLHSGYGHVYLYMVLLSECTTPFVNLRWYLSIGGLKDTKAYMINGMLLFLSWLVFRIVLFVYFFSHLYLHYHEVKQIHDVGFYYLFTSPPLLALMNVIWFQRIAKGLVKVLTKRD